MTKVLICSTPLSVQVPQSGCLKPRTWASCLLPSNGHSALQLKTIRSLVAQRNRAITRCFRETSVSRTSKLAVPCELFQKSGSCLVPFVVAALTIFNSDKAFAAVDDPLCIGFAGENTYALIVLACVVQAVALVGAAVGGILARQRKMEVEKINVQLRQIFAKMRRQYQVENYAPSLTYAPVGIGRSQEEVQTNIDPTKEDLMKHLRQGKQFLREKNPSRAFEEFQKALTYATELNDRVEQKKAARGLGASCQRQGKYRDAIKFHSMVLTISHITGEHSGYTEALGAIADCHTELGDLESAAKFYDQYIGRLDDED